MVVTPLERKGLSTPVGNDRWADAQKARIETKSCVVLRLPVQLAPHGNIPHRHHLLLAALAAAVLVPARHRRHRRIHPRLVALVAPVDIGAPDTAGGATAIVAADQRA